MRYRDGSTKKYTPTALQINYYVATSLDQCFNSRSFNSFLQKHVWRLFTILSVYILIISVLLSTVCRSRFQQKLEIIWMADLAEGEATLFWWNHAQDFPTWRISVCSMLLLCFFFFSALSIHGVVCTLNRWLAKDGRNWMLVMQCSEVMIVMQLVVIMCICRGVGRILGKKAQV